MEASQGCTFVNMDSLTQIVLGAAIGEAVLGKKVGYKAALYGAIAGTIPDLDVFVKYFVDEITAIEWHRGFTHSILFSILAAPLLGKLVATFETKVGWKDWTTLFFWGLLTHPILDAFTTWGTQLFWPFEINLAYKSIFVIDPLYTLPFLVFLVLALRLPKDSLKRRKLNHLGLFISTSYLLLTVSLKGVSYYQFKSALDEQGIAYQEIQTRPSPFNVILWNANVKLEDEYLLADYSFFDSKPIQFRSFPKNESLLGEFVDDPNVIRLKKNAQYWYTISINESDDVFLNDLRFGLISSAPNETTFVFEYWLFNKNERKLKITESQKSRGDAQKLLADLWKRVKGN